ncbi:unnamed protein product [Clonostachys chloroleuca]|uniref:Vegetative incompatibility protein HET-E-1 n=1 Tax=Clonostachys chloroleuca TaxID=1926264 RepID=A0AA35LZH8_9HYPO|nr:unnamed protein product [Clonostachys chloroleuca]
MPGSRWFSRGWTLQELIAPKERHFYDVDWEAIPEWPDLLQTFAQAGNLPVAILEDRDQLPYISVADRMAMASRRTTTRSEDMAYCLFGIFDVNLLILYGEGARKAFRRLQLEIMATNPFDHSIFAWSADRSDSGLLASSPSDFANTSSIGDWSKRAIDSLLVPFSMTNVGLSFNCSLVDEPEEEDFSVPDEGPITYALAPLLCDLVDDESSRLCLNLQCIPQYDFFVNGDSLPAYRRVKCSEWMLVPRAALANAEFGTIVVLEDEQFRFLKHPPPNGGLIRMLR